MPVTVDVPPDAALPTFADLGVADDLVDALADVGIRTAFPIQALSLPIALKGDDVIGQARTGTGKTLAFGLALLQNVVVGEDADGRPQALVVVPTRELCVQVARDLVTAGARRGPRVVAIYGGRAYEPQVEALSRGVEVVVGTPGRLLDLVQRGDLNLSGVRSLVLDEADEMLDLGFLPDVERILERLPTTRQTMLFSATMPSEVVQLSRRFLSSPVRLTAEEPDEGRTVPLTAQHVFRAHNLDKPEVLARVLQARGRGLAMVFCRTKRTCDKVAEEMTSRGFAAAAVHGDLGQGAREQALRAFRSGKIDTLVATDVAARGIDVVGVTHVINYQCPDDEKTYLHRIGRTGRAGESGVAVTLVDWDDLPKWSWINKALDLPFGEPPETYSSSPSLYAELDIPEGTTGRLPRARRTREGLDAEEVEDLGETGRAAGTRARAGSRRGSRDEGRDQGRERGREQGRAAGTASPPRARRRTRSGGAAAAGAGAASDGEGTRGGPVGTVDGDDATSGTAPRRRRRRGRRGRGGGADADAAGSAPAEGLAEAG